MKIDKIKFHIDLIFLLIRSFIRSFSVILTLSFLFCGCKKFILVESPDTSVTGQSAFESDQTAISSVTSLFTQLSNDQFNTFTIPNISTWIAGLSSDEFTLWSGYTNESGLAYYQNELNANIGTGTEVWNDSYKYLYICNSAVEGLKDNIKLTPSIRNQLLGEAKFMRAFYYFYLVNLYGEVPLVLSTDYDATNLLPRTSKDNIYKQIISDLVEAKRLLSNLYLDASLVKESTERIRPNSSVASALLARVYLYTNNWALAEAEASLVISNSYYQLLSPASVFLKNSKEAIWQLQPTSSGYNTAIGLVLNVPSTGPSNSTPITLSKSLLKSFENNDARLSNWTGRGKAGTDSFYYARKYRISQFDVNVTSTAQMTEYLTVLRLSEQFLIRAEARTYLGSTDSAVADLNKVRQRATLPVLNPTPQSSLLSVILHERQVEMFSEWGHRWFDIKRTGIVDSVMSVATPLKGGTWKSYKQLYPVPLKEIIKNLNLSQNTGY